MAGAKSVFYGDNIKHQLLERLHTHRLFAGVGSGSGRGVFHTYWHCRCRWSV